MAIAQWPCAGSTYSTDAHIPSGSNWAWLGFQPSPGASSGSMVWYFGKDTVTGSPFLPMVVEPVGGPYITPFPISHPAGFYAASISGGCAIVLMKS